MKPKELRDRWREAGFVESALPQLQKLVAERRLQGPVDLRGLVFGAEGAIPFLVDKNLVGAHVREADLSLAHLEGSMSNARFEDSTFEKAKFSHVFASKANFLRCSFLGAQLQMKADDACFDQCSMVETSFIGARALQEWGGRRATFKSCNLSNATFRGVEFRASSFEDCVFDGAVFSGCDLRGAKFVGSVPALEDCVL